MGAGSGLTMRRGTPWKAEKASAGAPDRSRNVTGQGRPRSQLRLMTSDQGDLRASAFPLVLAAASIGEGARRRSSIPPRSHKCNIPAQLSPPDVLQAGGPGSPSKAKSTSSPVLILVPTFSRALMESSNGIMLPLLQVEPGAAHQVPLLSRPRNRGRAETDLGGNAQKLRGRSQSGSPNPE